VGRAGAGVPIPVRLVVDEVERSLLGLQVESNGVRHGQNYHMLKVMRD
jgi:hypothetical protein